MFLMHCRHDGNRRGWRSEAAKPPAIQPSGGVNLRVAADLLSDRQILQQAVTAITLSAGIFVFSPWLLLILVICVVPAFIGESHFAFLGYTLHFRQTPVRRQLDYLRGQGATAMA